MSLDLASPAFAIAAGGAVLAGLVRGFSGFGAAMVLVPILAATYTPTLAVPVLQLTDFVLTCPLAWRARRRCAWRDVLPLWAGHALAVPFGLVVLVLADPAILTRAMGLLVIAVAAAMALGLRRRTTPGRLGTFFVGQGAGFLSGATGIGGPPVVLFWLSGQDAVPTVRANILVFFTLAGIVAILAMGVAGLLTREALVLTAALLPPYALGLLVGARAFAGSDERIYRPIALAIIFAVGFVTVL